MQIDDVFDNIQTQPSARTVTRARTVGFIESVKNMRDIVCRDTAARVANGKLAECTGWISGHAQPSAVIDKFHRVVNQIIDRAEHMVTVAHDHQPVGKIGFDFDIFGGDFLFK